MKPREVLEGMFQQGPRMIRTPRSGGGGPAGGPSAFAGRTTLASGSTSVTVSTAVVNSDSIFLKGSIVASAGVGANSGGAIVVNSIVSGVSFAWARATGAAVPWDEIITWELALTTQVR